MPSKLNPSFAKGEISPSLYGRVDTAAYDVALAKAKNVVIHPYGGASKRPGTKFIAPVSKHSLPPRLVPFVFNSEDQVVLEIGEQYIRFIEDGQLLREAQIVVTGATRALPVEITTSSAHGYSNGDTVYLAGLGGMTELNNKYFIVGSTTSTTFTLVDQAVLGGVDGTGFSTYTSGGLSRKVYEITSPYGYNDLWELKFAQSADVITITHPDYPSKDLARLGSTNWTLSDVNFTPSQDHPTGGTVTVNTTGSETRTYAVTSLNLETFEESLTFLNNTSQAITGATNAAPVVLTVTSHPFENGDEIEINSVGGMEELNGRRFIVANETTNTIELLGTDGTGFGTYSSARS